MSKSYRSICGIAVYDEKISKFAKELGNYSTPAEKEGAFLKQRELQRYLGEKTPTEMQIIWKIFRNLGSFREVVGDGAQDGYIKFLVAVWIYKSGKLRSYSLADVRSSRTRAKKRDQRHHTMKQKLAICEQDIKDLRNAGMPYREIPGELKKRHWKMFKDKLPHWKTVEKFFNGRF